MARHIRSAHHTNCAHQTLIQVLMIIPCPLPTPPWLMIIIIPLYSPTQQLTCVGPETDWRKPVRKNKAVRPHTHHLINFN